MSDKIYDVSPAWQQRALPTKRSTRRCTRTRSRTRTGSGPSRPSVSTGSNRSPRSRTFPSIRTTSRSNGSRTARSTRLQLHRPASRQARQSGRDHLGGRRSERRQEVTYKQLHAEVCKFANVLQSAGRQERRPRHHLHADDSGSGVSPCSPARASAPSIPWFSAVSPNSLAGRIEDCIRTMPCFYCARRGAGRAVRDFLLPNSCSRPHR